MSETLYLPSAANGLLHEYKFAERRLRVAFTAALAASDFAPAQAMQSQFMPSNRNLYNRPVSLLKDRNGYGFAPSLPDKTAPAAETTLYTFGATAVGATDLLKKEAALDLVKAISGIDLRAVGRYTSDANVGKCDAVYNYVGIKVGSVGGYFVTPAWAVHAILDALGVPHNWGSLCILVNATTGVITVTTGTYSNLTAWSPEALQRSAELGLSPQYSSTGTEYNWRVRQWSCIGIDSYKAPNWVAHGLHPALDRFILDGEGGVSALGGTVSYRRLGTYLKEQRPRVPAYQNPEFDQFVASLLALDNLLFQWAWLDEPEDPPDLWNDPQINEARNSSWMSKDTVESTKVAGVELKEWRTRIQQAGPRRMFYRSIKPQALPVMATVDIGFNAAASVYTFTSNGGAIALDPSQLYYAGTVPAGDRNAHVLAAENQSGARFVDDDVSGLRFGVRQSMAHPLELSKEVRWLYTLASENAASKAFANACGILCTTADEMNVVYV